MPPFKGLVVVELASVLAGPAVGQFFAELGATVHKIESPQGDVTRTWRLPSEDPARGVSAYYASVNWGKKAQTLDLETAAGQTQLRNLAQMADVLVTNLKPSSLHKLGAAPEALQAQNPRLIIGLLTGYGPGNPRLGYDAVAQAETGFMHLNGEPDGPPTKLPVAMMDLLAAHQLKQALLVALLQRTQTGLGQVVQVSLVASGLAALANQATAHLVAGHDPGRMGSGHPQIAPYGTVFYDAEGLPLVLAVGSDRQFAQLADALGATHVAHDPRFATNPLRVRNRPALHKWLQQALGHVQRGPFLSELERRGVPAGAVHTLPEALALPEAQPLLLADAETGLKGLATVAFDTQNLSWRQRPMLPPA